MLSYLLLSCHYLQCIYISFTKTRVYIKFSCFIICIVNIYYIYLFHRFFRNAPKIQKTQEVEVTQTNRIKVRHALINRY